MQELTSWRSPGGALGRLTAAAHLRAGRLAPVRADFEARVAAMPSARSMAAALMGPSIAVVAEVKRRSPSKGPINDTLDAPQRARLYAGAGARAISVLTEPEEFAGSPQDLEETAATIAVPVLKKDFHVAEVQVLEARVLGAAAILLIARALPRDRLRQLAAFAMATGLEPLIEVRSEAELEDALSTGAPMIGVNARDLETLQVDPSVVERLIPQVPAARLAIAESGIGARADVMRVGAAGADAVLVGSALSAAADAADLMRELAGVARVPRGT